MIRNMWSTASIVSLALIATSQSVLAGGAPVPGPIVGAGLPLLLAAGGVYLAVKLVRSRRG